jgi:hypothetical protein
MNHFECAGAPPFHEVYKAVLSNTFGYNGNFYCSEYRNSSCSRSGGFSLGLRRLAFSLFFSRAALLAMGSERTSGVPRVIGAGSGASSATGYAQ